MTKKIFLLVALNLILYSTFAQRPDTIWTNTIGGVGDECSGYTLADKPKMVFCSDGNLLVSGKDTSGFISPNYGSFDVFITKINPDNGDTIWTKNYGGEDWDFLTDIIATPDGGAIFCGYTYSVSNFGIHHDGSDTQDGFIAKIDNNGTLLWVKQYGGGDFLGNQGNDVLYKLVDLGSGNYIALGQTNSNNGDLTVDLTKFACGWILKIDSQGNKIFSKKIASPDHNEYNANVFKSGTLLSSKNDIILFGEIAYWQAAYKNWLVKIDTNGVEKWQKTNGCLSDNMACEIASLPNNEAVFTGLVYSQDGDVSPYVNTGLYSDIWIAKIDSSGNIIKQNVIGGMGADKTISIAVNSNGVYLGGMSNSHQFDLVIDSLGMDMFLAKLNSNLDTVWTFKFGGSGTSESISSIVLMPQSNHFFVAGNTNSNDRFIHDNHGGSDVWVAKFEDVSVGVESISSNSNFDLFPNPAQNRVDIVIPETSKNSSIAIYNSFGQMVFSCKSTDGKMSLNLESFPNGFYFVTLYAKEKSSTQKLIIHKD